MAEELCTPDVRGRLIESIALALRHARMQFVVTRHRGAPGTLIIERRSGCRSSRVEGAQQFAGLEYVKVGFESIHQQRDNGDLSPGGESKAKRGRGSLFELRPISDTLTLLSGLNRSASRIS
jgi:hypothetical protein